MKNNVVYHYCSFETFKRIIENPRFKLTDITKSNDKYEIIYLWNSYIDYIKKNSNNSLAVNGLEYEIKNQLSKTTYLTACFSEHKDSLLLWKMYADAGISLGFDKQLLKSLSNRITVINNCVALTDCNTTSSIANFDKVNYVTPSKIKSYAEEKCKGKEFVTDAFGDFFKDSSFFKTDFWKSEKEWRLVVPLIECSNDIDIQKFKSDDISIPEFVEMELSNYRGYSNAICCYIPFKKESLKSVTIAPNCNITEKEIRFILRQNGFDADNIAINKSNGGLR